MSTNKRNRNKKPKNMTSQPKGKKTKHTDDELNQHVQISRKKRHKDIIDAQRKAKKTRSKRHKQSSSTETTVRRIKKELKEFKDTISTCTNILKGGPIGDDLFKWQVTIIGPEGTPYQNGHYDLQMHFPQDYPANPPSIHFLTKIHHCNISDDCGINCNILTNKWSPALTISKTLMILQSCMVTGGNPSDPLVPNIANKMLSNPEVFVQIASIWNVKYANGDAAPNPISNTSFKNFEPWTDKERYKQLHKDREQHIQLCRKQLKTYHKTRFKDNKQNDMKIFVKALNGAEFTIECRSADFVLTIKMLLQKHTRLTRFPLQIIYLIFEGYILMDYDTLMDRNIKNLTTLHLVLKLSMIKKGESVNKDKSIRREREEKMNERKALSSKQCVEKVFFEFLEGISLEKYFDKFKENECADMESIRYFDDDILKNDIGIKSTIARKRFIGRCGQIVKEMDSFRNEYGLSSVLHKRLGKKGIVTMDILTMSVAKKSDLKNIYKIEHDDDVNALWKMMKQNEKNQMEGNNNDDK